MMDDIQKEALLQSTRFLVQNIIPDTLWDVLLVKGIFTEMMLEPMKACKEKSKGIWKLLSDLNTRPKEAYEDFISCLIDTGQQHCADEIRKHEYKVRQERSCGHDERQEGIPAPVQESDPGNNTFNTDHEDTHVMESDQRKGMSPVQESHPTSISGSFVAYHYNCVFGNDVYRMESETRGFVYIVNNDNFDCLDKRNGTDVDCQKLSKLFSMLGYFVCSDKDLKAKEMERRLKEFSKHPDNKIVDSLVVVILSHGDHGDKIFGSDGYVSENVPYNYITKDNLKSWFGNRMCPELEGKPKLFIIQACRGGTEDKGYASASQCNDVVADDVAQGNCEELSNITCRPDQSDMIFAHATTQGYVSYRNEEEGSVFINALVDVFSQKWHQEHLADMLTMVNKKIVDEFQHKKGFKTLASPVNQLTKKWFFNPDTGQH